MHRDDVHVALAQNITFIRRFFGYIQSEQRAGLFVHHRLGAVDVLGFGVVQHTAAEGDDGPAHIDDGHHDAVAEDVVEIALGAALDEAGVFQLFLGEAEAAQVMQQAGEILGRVAQTEAADGGVGQAALFPPVAAGQGGFGRTGVELLVKVAGGAAIDL